MNNTGVAAGGTVAPQERRQSRTPSRRGTVGARRRAALEVLALVVIAALLIAGPLLSRSHAPADLETTKVRAEAGDTLWAIAQDHPIAGLTTAQTVEVIARINRLQSLRVGIGRTLSVPQVASHLAVASK